MMRPVREVPTIPTARFELVSMSVPFMRALLERDLGGGRPG